MIEIQDWFAPKMKRKLEFRWQNPVWIKLMDGDFPEVILLVSFGRDEPPGSPNLKLISTPNTSFYLIVSELASSNSYPFLACPMNHFGCC